MNTILQDYGIEIIFPVVYGYIYAITNKSNKKVYIGQTKDIKRRIENHLQGKGSPKLLQDIVKQGIETFEFEVLHIAYSPCDMDNLEDTEIQKHDCLHPLGYNLRVNRSIEANGEAIDLNNFSIQGKFVFQSSEQKCFSIGECSLARSYQTLLNIKENTETAKIKKMKHFKFKYLELRIESDITYIVGQTYDLSLKYRFNEDKFVILE
jgi:hypothetical protein